MIFDTHTHTPSLQSHTFNHNGFSTVDIASVFNKNPKITFIISEMFYYSNLVVFFKGVSYFLGLITTYGTATIH